MKTSQLKLYHELDIRHYTRTREGETKIGEKAKWINNFPDDLFKSHAKFVLLGLPEDIGVRANFGRGGAHTAWKPALENILNIQSNSFFSGESVLILGHIDFENLMQQSLNLNSKSKNEIKRLRELVSEIDECVYNVLKVIFSTGKIPIIIGGGHNNAYPIIKAAASVVPKNKINVLNCDPHTDFRNLEGRHSGNGFSYAFQENFLNRYSVFGIHESYNTNEVLKRFLDIPQQLHFKTFEEMFISQNISFEQAINECIEFCKTMSCGLELDLDSITNVPSSAKTSSGLSPIQARQFVYHSAKKLKPIYFHIAEGAPVLAHIKADNKTGKLIAYLVADFIKAFE